jgi:hypothetical protein
MMARHISHEPKLIVIQISKSRRQWIKKKEKSKHEKRSKEKVNKIQEK